jgi:hypothetical protein
MIVIKHQGAAPDDRLEIESESLEEAINLLLDKRGVEKISELLPPVIETRWC